MWSSSGPERPTRPPVPPPYDGQERVTERSKNGRARSAGRKQQPPYPNTTGKGTPIMSLNEHIAKEIIRERSTHRMPTQRPTHPRTAKVLRRIADRFDSPA